MITLYTFGPFFGQPDASPFVIKAMLLLKMAGLDYKAQPAAPFKAPKGKLPYIDDDGEKVADSTFIRFHIEKKYGFDFDAGLTPEQKATGWALEKLCEDHLYWLVLAERWMDEGNFAKGPARFFEFRSRSPAADSPRDDPRQDQTGFASPGALSPQFGRAPRTDAARSGGDRRPDRRQAFSFRRRAARRGRHGTAPSSSPGSARCSRARRAMKSKRSPLSSPTRGGSRRFISRRRPEHNRPFSKKGRSRGAALCSSGIDPAVWIQLFGSSCF